MVSKRISRVKEVEQALLHDLTSLQSPNGALPSEPEIAERFNVSRVTVRQALTSLENKGIVIRKHGLGTFVNQHVLNIQNRLDKALEFNELIRTSGFEPEVRLLQASFAPLSNELAERLQTPASGNSLIIRKVYTADRTPVIYCVDIVPLPPQRNGLSQGDLPQFDLRLPIYSLLKTWFNESFTYFIADVDVCSADNLVAEALQIRPGAPILFIEQTAYNPADRPAFHSLEYYRPGYIHFRLPRQITFHED
jgi:GntR family transcriptional regulator